MRVPLLDCLTHLEFKKVLSGMGCLDGFFKNGNRKMSKYHHVALRDNEEQLPVTEHFCSQQLSTLVQELAKPTIPINKPGIRYLSNTYSSNMHFVPATYSA